MPTEVIWVLVNCGGDAEATKIGNAVLAARQASCFDIFPRTLARYFWPPRSGKIEEARGALLVLETFDQRFDAVASIVRESHGDTLPFIGAIRIEHVSDAYREWMSSELAEPRV